MFSCLREQQVQNAAFCEESVVFTPLTYKNVHRFRDGPIHELYDLKASQMSKVRASSHEYPHVEKNKNLREQNFKGEATTSNWRGPVMGGGGGGGAHVARLNFSNCLCRNFGTFSGRRSEFH